MVTCVNLQPDEIIFPPPQSISTLPSYTASAKERPTIQADKRRRQEDEKDYWQAAGLCTPEQGEARYALLSPTRHVVLFALL